MFMVDVDLHIKRYNFLSRSVQTTRSRPLLWGFQTMTAIFRYIFRINKYVIKSMEKDQTMQWDPCGRYTLNLTSIQNCTANAFATSFKFLHKRIFILIPNKMDIEETVRMDTILISINSKAELLWWWSLPYLCCLILPIRCQRQYLIWYLVTPVNHWSLRKLCTTSDWEVYNGLQPEWFGGWVGTTRRVGHKGISNTKEGQP